MTSPAQYDPKIIPAVSLGGQLWPIPTLAVRQLREVRTPLLEMNRRLAAARSSELAETFVSLNRDDYDALIVEPVYYALTRAHPEMTRDEFMDMAIGDGELISAWFVIRNQSGLFAPSRNKEPDEGEAQAAKTTSPTGT